MFKIPDGVTLCMITLKRLVVLTVWAIQVGQENGLAAYLVEDVVVALPGQLVDHSALLQQVRLDQGSTDVVAAVKVDLDELAKATGVVVAQRLGVSKSLQQRVGCQHSVLDSCTACQSRQVLHRKPTQVSCCACAAFRFIPKECDGGSHAAYMQQGLKHQILLWNCKAVKVHEGQGGKGQGVPGRLTCMAILVVSVFPEPLSPVMTRLWLALLRAMAL